MKRMIRPLTLALLSAGLAACVHAPDGTLPKGALDEALRATPDAVPAAVEQELLSMGRPVAASQSAPLRRFDIAARDVDAREFFAALGSQHNVSIAVHPDVSGTITLNLRRVTLPEILEAISGLYGYGIERRSGVYQVFPNGVRTRTFNVNYLMLSRNGQSQTAISGSSLGSGEDGSSGDGSATRINTESSNNFWADLESALGRLIGDEAGRVVVTNPQAGLVTVRAAPDELALVADFLTRAERQLKRQVILEARIVEVELNDGYEQGIDWQHISRGADRGSVAGDSGSLLNPVATLVSAGGSLQSYVDQVFTFSDGDFSAVVNMLRTQGEVNTLSNPRVTTSNNQKAVIKVGTDEYFVTDFSLTTTNTNGVSESTPDIELSPFFSGISLDVTPQIADDNRVLLHIHPAVSEVEDNIKSINFGQGELQLPLAKSTIRESDTIVEAASGELIIIGGLMQEKQFSTESGLPILSEIPVLGQLFKNQKVGNRKSELVIMLRPVVVNENTWQTELQRSRDLLEKWYPPQPAPYSQYSGG